MLPPFAQIVENFELLDESDDRYRYLIELGREMPPLAPEAHTDANKVQGCASQVWLDLTTDGTGPDAVVTFAGDSDAHIVKGLVAVLVSLLSGRSAASIVAADPEAELARVGLAQHITRQRSDGFRSMVRRIKGEAQRAAALPA